MGGIYARYAVGMLFDTHTRQICGLQPASFVTTASPHLGLHGFVSKMLERVTSNLLYGGLTAEQMFLADSEDRQEQEHQDPNAKTIAVTWRDINSLLIRRHSFPSKPILARDYKYLPSSRTSNHEVMLHVRGHGAGEEANHPVSGSGQGSHHIDEQGLEPPLLVAMTTDRPLPFLSALASFRFRVAYGNTCNDPVVPYETATIACQPLRDWRTRPPISPSFPHIVDDSMEHVHRWPPEVSDAEEARSNGDARERDVATMRRNLERLGWRRVSARFLRSVRVGDRQAVLPGILGAVGVDAHNCLPVVRPLLNGLGRDSVNHLCAVLQEHSRLLTPAAAAPSGDVLGIAAWHASGAAGDRPDATGSRGGNVPATVGPLAREPRPDGAESTG